MQTCTVHLIRRALGYASYNDRKAMAAGAARHLHRVRRRRRLRGAGGILRHAAGAEVPGRDGGLGKGVGPVHPVPGIRARAAESPLHDECDRVVQPGDAESPEDARPVPER